MTKSIFFFGEPVPQGPALLDGLDRRIVLTSKGFRYSGRPIPATDLEWPIRLETLND